jgi:DNA-binding HxlR family transcriptional regulator
MEWIVIMTASPPKLRGFATPRVMPIGCPVAASLGVLGRKWALLVLRDVAFYEDIRFSDILRNNEGLTPRVLTFRLRELLDEGFITKREGRDGREVVYDLTQKGKDAIPILTAFTSFGFVHHADRVFPDKKPRTLGEVLPGSQDELLRALRAYALEGRHERIRPARAAATAPRRGRPRAS